MSNGLRLSDYNIKSKIYLVFGLKGGSTKQKDKEMQDLKEMNEKLQEDVKNMRIYLEELKLKKEEEFSLKSTNKEFAIPIVLIRMQNQLN